MGLFSSLNYRWGNIAGMLLVFTFAGSEFLLPFSLELVRGLSTGMVGMLLAVPAISLMLAGLVAGRLTDRYGSRGLMIVAALLSAATMVLFSFMDAATGLPFIIATLVLEGIAVGLFMPPNMSLVLGSGKQDAGGVASSGMMTLRNAGAVFGIATLGTVAMHGFAGSMTGMGTPAPEQLVPGFHAAFLAGAFVCMVVAGIAVFIQEKRGGSISR
jgi:MFS family permease